MHTIFAQRDALGSVIAAIDHEFAIESVTVIEPYIFHDKGVPTSLSNMIHIAPGTYPVGELIYNLNSPGLIEADTLLANHLYAIGKASLTMKSGVVKPVSKKAVPHA